MIAEVIEATGTEILMKIAPCYPFASLQLKAVWWTQADLDQT